MERSLVSLLGFNIDTFGLEDAVEFAKGLIFEDKGGQVVTINPEMIEAGLKNNEFAEILYNADLLVPDGVGIKLALKIKGTDIQRVAGIEFSKRLIEECAKNNFSVAFVGAKPNILEKAVQNLKNELPELNIVFKQNGYFQKEEEILWYMGERQPQVIFVALGSPKQEEFIQKYRVHNPNALMIGIGGSLDVWSGEIERAPEIYQRLGLEWLYRTIKEPKRFGRIFPTLPRFLFRVIFS